MRLWHESLIPHLDRQRLLGQHRECAALRGNGWGKKHSTVDYVFKYSPARLFQYHFLIMNEMISRGYCPDNKWFGITYRGKNQEQPFTTLITFGRTNDSPIYPEHNGAYLQECLENLRGKGINIKVEVVI